MEKGLIVLTMVLMIRVLESRIAIVLPSFKKAGFSVDSLSNWTFLYSSSSVTVISPFFEVTTTGTNSSLKALF